MDSILNLFWNLNTTDNTKYIIIFLVIICIIALCFFSGKKKTTRKNKSVKLSSTPSTKCERNYVKCMENNIKNKRNDFCYPCLDDGNAPDFFYDPKIKEWRTS